MTSNITCFGCGSVFQSPGRFMNHGKYSQSCTREMRFWGKVDKSAGPDACWPWTGAITSHGYGCVAAGNNRVVGAHKAAYQFAKGEVPAGHQIMHSCDNRPCCNPAHLSTGTLQDNANDKVAKGRQVGGHYHKKLQAADVLEIRKLKGVVRSGLLAERFGVDQPHIINIWNRKVWKGI